MSKPTPCTHCRAPIPPEAPAAVGGLAFCCSGCATVYYLLHDAGLERYYELLRARTPLARITIAAKQSATVRSLAESAIRAADPQAPAGVVRARLASRLYGTEVTARLFPGVQLDVG